MTDYKELIIKNKKLISISIISIIIISTLFIGIIYKIKKDDTIEKLENAIFEIDQFNIVDARKDILTLQFHLNISNIDGSSNSKLIKSKKIFLSIDIGQNERIDVEFPVSGGSLSKSRLITFTVPILTEIKTNTFSNLISDIVAGIPVDLNFKGTLYYSISNTISDSITFSNILHIKLDENPLSIKINQIYIYNEIIKKADIDITIFNPFSATIDITGNISLFVSNYQIGTIFINQDLKLLSGITNSTQKLQLIDFPAIAMQNYLDNYNSSILLSTKLSITIDELTLLINPKLEVIINPMLFEASIDSINDLVLNSTTNSIFANLNINVTSFIPIELNVTRIQFTIATSSGKQLGMVESNQFVNLKPFIPRMIFNVSANFTNINAALLLEVVINKQLKITDGIIFIKVFDQIIQFNFDFDEFQIPT